MATDPPIYNAAAAKAIASVPAASRIQTLDLYAVAAKRCGTQYSRCPEGCVESRPRVGNCYQIPLNVHFEPQGWAELSAAYMDAVLKAVGE